MFKKSWKAAVPLARSCHSPAPEAVLRLRVAPIVPAKVRQLDVKYALIYICMMMQQSVFQTLADPTRLRIVEALAGGEQAVGDLVRAVDIDQSGVSRHLRILGEAGFVAMRPDGARRLYSLQPEPFRAIDDWVRSYRKLWEGRLERFDAAVARRGGAQQSKGKK